MYKIIGADQKEYGPVSAEQLRQWMSEGRVNGQTKVQPAGSAEWKMMADVPEFAGFLPKTLPPSLTPVIPITPLPAKPGASPMAVWALVTGILSVLCCQFLAPVAIVLGALAISKIKSHPELTGNGFAVTGLILGIVAILITIAVIVFFFFNPALMQNFTNVWPQSQ